MFTIRSKTCSGYVEVLAVPILQQHYRVCQYKIFIAQMREAKMGDRIFIIGVKSTR
jgi:hypothetical protein